jgi:hypothetical protein
VGTEAEAARAEVVASREAFSAELARLEASGRAAVDIKAKVRRNPGRTAGMAAGAGFLAVGGPGKVARGVGRAFRGKRQPLPPSLLPAEVDRAISSLGDDGEKVRGTLEREFANYLEKAKPGKDRNRFGGLTGIVATSLALPVGRALVKRFSDQLVGLEELDIRRAVDSIRNNPAHGTPAPKPPAASPSTPPKPPAAQ